MEEIVERALEAAQEAAPVSQASNVLLALKFAELKFELIAVPQSDGRSAPKVRFITEAGNFFDVVLYKGGAHIYVVRPGKDDISLYSDGYNPRAANKRAISYDTDFVRGYCVAGEVPMVVAKTLVENITTAACDILDSPAGVAFRAEVSAMRSAPKPTVSIDGSRRLRAIMSQHHACAREATTVEQYLERVEKSEANRAAKSSGAKLDTSTINI